MSLSKQCEKIAHHYGKEAQTKQAIQELSALICLLTSRPDQEHNGIVEAIGGIGEIMTNEIADCLIMLEQVRILYGIDGKQVEAMISAKIARQMERIARER